jgi:enamine deaminase RidA (YjgF/YER057c/UK114 family)
MVDGRRTALGVLSTPNGKRPHQAELVEDASRWLVCAGQASIDAEGAPQHAGDMGAQIALCFDNLDAVLAGAGMSLANVVRLNYYVTDMDVFFEHFGVIGERLRAAGAMGAGTLLKVDRLAFPELMVEIEATAAD